MFGKNREKKKKHDFQPRSHAMVYLIAIIYIAYLMFQLVNAYRKGGPNAPSLTILVAGLAVLGIGIVALAVFAYWMNQLQPPKKDAPPQDDDDLDWANEDWEPDELDEPVEDEENSD